MHGLLAATLKTPELMLDKVEANNLAQAVAQVADHYPTAIDPRVIAWVNLSVTVGVIYGPRIFVIRQRYAQEAEARRKAAAQPTFGGGGSITEFRPNPG